MSVAASFPVPEGIGASFSNVVANVQTANFTLDAGLAIATFQPVDPNNPGTVTLATSAGTTVITMSAGGYGEFLVPVGGQTYHFTATQGANLLAGTLVSNMAR